MKQGTRHHQYKDINPLILNLEVDVDIDTPCIFSLANAFVTSISNFSL